MLKNVLKERQLIKPFILQLDKNNYNVTPICTYNYDHIAVRISPSY